MKTSAAVVCAVLGFANADTNVTQVLMEKIKAQEALIKELESQLDGPAPGGRKLLFGHLSVAHSAWKPLEPIVPGIMPGTGNTPRILLGIDVDYPPYGTLIYPPDATDTIVGGFGPDVAAGLMEVCDIEVTTIRADWNLCWDYDGLIGDDLKHGLYHGCETYTHTKGTRNQYLEFSAPILDLNKKAGFLVKLDADGTPMVDPTSDLSDKIVVDVSGWAPTADTVTVLVNDCTGGYFAVNQATMLSTNTDADLTGYTGGFSANMNEVALYMLMDGQADAVYIYADQAYQYITNCEDPLAEATVDCDMWNMFGQANGYAYVHTGMSEYAYAGTTLAISKKGSGLKDILDPCIASYLETESYYDVCVKWSLEGSCFANSFFPSERRLLAKDHTGTRHVGRKLTDATPAYDLPTPDQTAGCSDGYCACTGN